MEYGQKQGANAKFFNSHPNKTGDTGRIPIVLSPCLRLFDPKVCAKNANTHPGCFSCVAASDGERESNQQNVALEIGASEHADDQPGNPCNRPQANPEERVPSVCYERQSLQATTRPGHKTPAASLSAQALDWAVCGWSNGGASSI